MIDPVINFYLTVIEQSRITFDRCFICGWVGLSEDVQTDNRCPRCGSLDMDDIDAKNYEEY